MQGGVIMDREQAEAHWEYTEQLLLLMMKIVHFAYVEAMVHGAKHDEDNNE